MGGFSSNRSRSSSENLSVGSSFIDPGQRQFFNQLFQGTQDLVGQQAGQIGGAAGQLSSQLFGQGQGFLGQLQGQQAQGVGQQIGQLSQFSQNPLFQSLQAQFQGGGGPGNEQLQQLAQGGSGGGQLAGSQQLQNLAGGSSNVTDALLQQNPALQGQLREFNMALQENLRATSGTIAGQATLGGATGGSRQALATGLAGAETSRQFGQGAQDLFAADLAQRQGLAAQFRGQDQQAQLAAAGQLQQGDLAQRGLNLAGQQNQLGAIQGLQQNAQFNAAGISDLLAQSLQGQAQAGQLGIAQGGLQGAASQVGLGSLNNLFNLGMSPFAAQFSPFLAAASIFGDPTVVSSDLSRSTSTSTGRGSGFQILSFSESGGGGD